ncbi:MAG: response regulator [Flavipsychrobacter sp.]|jgi:DNA-binding response OmpR family regulator|nr:response regulator [Flavipsychrobacter sp.]
MPNILVIDDDTIMLKTIQYILNKDGYNVVTATDGREAYELLDYSMYDVVITDLRMPRMDGMELISKLKGSQQNRTLGIIIVSMVKNKNTMADAMQMGADYFLHKPIIVDELRDTVKRLIQKKTTN